MKQPGDTAALAREPQGRGGTCQQTMAGTRLAWIAFWRQRPGQLRDFRPSSGPRKRAAVRYGLRRLRNFTCGIGKFYNCGTLALLTQYTHKNLPLQDGLRRNLVSESVKLHKCQ